MLNSPLQTPSVSEILMNIIIENDFYRSRTSKMLPMSTSRNDDAPKPKIELYSLVGM